MKHHINYSILTMLVFALFIASCITGDEFETPETATVEPQIEGILVDIGSIAGVYDQAHENVTFDGTNSYTEGYVISSDEAGNFFEEIIIQDKPKNPSFGIRILLDVNPLFTRYEPGRKIYVRLDGLTAGISNGVLTLGMAGDERIEKIPYPLEEEFVIRSSERDTIVPATISLEELPELYYEDDAYALANRWILLEDMQFNKDMVLGDDPLTYAAESWDRFDGERILESCSSDQTIIFSTSTFADFKLLQLPAGRGTIAALLTKNFFGDEWNLVVNDPSTVDLFDQNRCDPDD